MKSIFLNFYLVKCIVGSFAFKRKHEHNNLNVLFFKDNITFSVVNKGNLRTGYKPGLTWFPSYLLGKQFSVFTTFGDT